MMWFKIRCQSGAMPTTGVLLGRIGESGPEVALDELDDIGYLVQVNGNPVVWEHEGTLTVLDTYRD